MPSISKTKSGERYRAPTDQARKQDRKKENKRNKKDRQQIRQAMAKYSNMDETISKLLLLERQILGLDPQPFHIDVLRKKQKVLQDSINKRRMTLQQGKEEAELKKFNDKMSAYATDCNKLAVLAQQARLAREADPDMIPLPMGEASMAPPPQSMMMGGNQYMPPLPTMTKRKVDFQLPPRSTRIGQKPPGPPCGLAPNFSDSEEEEEMNDDEQYDDGDLAPVPIPEFDNPYPPMHRNYGPPSSFHHHNMAPPPQQRMMSAPNYHPHSHHPYNPMGFHQNPQRHLNDSTISSGPQITSRGGPGGSAPSATLSAAPELRNLRRETVKLVPAQLLRRPTDNRGSTVPVGMVPRATTVTQQMRKPEQQQTAKNTDEAYNDFMKELDGLI